MWRNVILIASILFMIIPAYAQQMESVRLEEWTGKTVMLFGGHPDDEFPAAGTMAILRIAWKLLRNFIII